MDTKRSFWIIFVLTAFVPVLVLPGMLDNPFNTPKSLLILLGVLMLSAIYLTRLLSGRVVLISPVRKWVIALVFLNLFSFFYTENYYYTKIAATLNISCLIIFFFFTISATKRQAVLLLWAMISGGVFVATITCLQFSGHYMIFRGFAGVVTSTIGNPNYLGAYLIFPFFAGVGLFYITHGKTRWLMLGVIVLVFIAILFARGRASWLGLAVSIPVFLISTKTFSRKILYLILGIVILIDCVWFISPRAREALDVYNIMNTSSIKSRTKYFQAGMWLVKESPLFGTGLWSYRNLVYTAQVGVARTNPTYFYNNPKPRRVHNEYIETLVDGGLVAGVFLLMFVVGIMLHGWRIIQDKSLPEPVRFITAAAFSSIIGIMVAAVFFFPFRINTTLFMSVVMLGVIEGLYCQTYGYVTEVKLQWFPPAVIGLMFLVLIGVFYFQGYRPFKGELAFFKYRQAMAFQDAQTAKKYILQAVSCDPGNSQYCLYAGQLYMDIFRDYVQASDYFERALIGFNGDLTLWSVHYARGVLAYRAGHLFEARSAFQKAIHYYPLFTAAKTKLAKINRILDTHSQIIIKLQH